jgi:hypothetical protein
MDVKIRNTAFLYLIRSVLSLFIVYNFIKKEPFVVSRSVLMASP